MRRHNHPTTIGMQTVKRNWHALLAFALLLSVLVELTWFSIYGSIVSMTVFGAWLYYLESNQKKGLEAEA